MQAIVNGFATGSLYGLLGLSFVLLVKATRVVNFAQGESVMLGAYAAWVFYASLGLPYPVVIPLVMGTGAVMGMAMERLLRRLIDAPEFSLVIATLAISIALKGAARLIAGAWYRIFPQPFSSEPFNLWGVAISFQNIWFVAVILAVVVAGYCIFYKTKMGLGMRAIAQNREAAQLMGVNMLGVFRFTWVLAGAVGALVGLLFAPIWQVDPDIGSGLILMSFSSAVLGGFGSLPGVIVGGWLIGTMENGLGLVLGPIVKDYVPFATIFLVLTIKPTGLFRTE